MKALQVNKSVQELREHYITLLENATNAEVAASIYSDNLYAIDLTVYSKDYSLESLFYNSFAKSMLDNNLSLHPEQLNIINMIDSNEALIISAPTSFGKTFSVFEYIARKKMNNIVLVVPTLALVEEYIKKIIKKYNTFFKEYKVHTQMDNIINYGKYSKNIFILTHDKVLQGLENFDDNIIDLLVIDEVYKLATDNDDRVLILNMAYYYLSKKAKKYVLLAPFISSIDNTNELEKTPVFYKTDYSPVVNKLIVEKILKEKERYTKCQNLISQFKQSDKTLVYFPTVKGMYKYVNEMIINEPEIGFNNSETYRFNNWIKEEFHPGWCVVKALSRGYVIHNGQLPLGIRMYLLNLFENDDNYNKLLCTSTLLEGVNTSAKNIIITKPSRKSERGGNFTAFDFYNLVGRTGRLNKHYVGNAYYIKGPKDQEYQKEDAIKSIRFELTDDSMDIDIQLGNIDKHNEYQLFLEKLNITHDDYMKYIGCHFRFNSIKNLYDSYKYNETKLLNCLALLKENPKKSRFDLINILYEISEGLERKYYVSLINLIINRKRNNVREIVEYIKEYYKNENVDTIISDTIKLKSSYIEHKFYKKIQIIIYFMNLNKIETALIDIINNKIISNIEYIYFISSKQKKMLKDIGIYDRDIDTIIKFIGEDFDDIFEMKKRLKEVKNKIYSLSFLSKYIIKNL